MNWYEIFYWIIVADGVKDFFDVFSNIFTWLAVLSLIVYLISLGVKAQCDAEGDEFDQKASTFWAKRCGGFFWASMILCVITWAGYVFTPTKKDAMIIIAGGAVGSFIASDSTVKEIPAELTLLVRERIKSEVQALKNPLTEEVDTLKNKSKEELIELLNQKNEGSN